MKRSLSDPKPSKGFYIGCADVKANHQIVVYPGQESYRHDPKTEIMPLDALLKLLSRLGDPMNLLHESVADSFAICPQSSHQRSKRYAPSHNATCHSSLPH